jgi:hypothetical protein
MLWAMQFQRSLAAFLAHGAGGLGEGGELFTFCHSLIILQTTVVCQLLRQTKLDATESGG